MKFLQLTDTHFVPPGEKLYGRDPRRTLNAAVADINAHHGDAELLVVTGDLTHWGEPDAFANLAQALAPLSMPVELLIGNHDARDVFARYFPGQGRDDNGFVQSVRETSAGPFIFLDTVLAGTHAGHYCETRCAWLAETLASLGDREVFLFMHHPPFDTGIPASDNIGLQQKNAFRQVIEPHRHRIRHLFYGHVHRPICGSWLGIPTSTLRAINHQVWFDMEGTKLRGSFEPPAYGVIQVADDRVVVHFHDFMDASEKFDLHDSPWDDWSRRRPHP
ncbi:MAG: phosphodiesterase [Rhodospirillaceae bacterium]|nr:phosphodiesterase [Rhodospirillaceae bacterium]